MKRLGLVVFATFVLIAPGAQAITCDDFESLLRKQATEMRKFSTRYEAIEGDYLALCLLGREEGLPYLRAVTESLTRFTDCALSANTAKKAIAYNQMVIALVEKNTARDCKAAGM